VEFLQQILPSNIKSVLNKLPDAVCAALEEIRIRECRPLEIVFNGTYAFISATGQTTSNSHAAFRPAKDDCVKLLDLLTNHSVYSFEEELRRGFITVVGGHRVGIAGRTVLERGQVKLIRDISCFNIRIAREAINSARELLPALLDYAKGTIHHTLVISPPQKGKTTIIRDIARLISYGTGFSALGMKGLKVAIIDERSELTACVQGVPKFDLGPRTDVMDGCPKAEGMMMMIRAMSPDVIVVDEIGRKEDAEAIHEALHAGIRVVATAHGADIEDIRSRPLMRQLVAEQVFSRYVVLRSRDGASMHYSVYDAQGNAC